MAACFPANGFALLLPAMKRWHPTARVICPSGDQSFTRSSGTAITATSGCKTSPNIWSQSKGSDSDLNLQALETIALSGLGGAGQNLLLAAVQFLELLF